VRGVDALRMVEASALPDMRSVYINAIVLMVSEQIQDMIHHFRCRLRKTYVISN
jgi:choline dehydrogenase-like flavoprotein